jgi:hypothetical protein
MANINIFERRYNKLKQITRMGTDLYNIENNNIIDNFQNFLGLGDQKNGTFHIKIEKLDKIILLKIKFIPNDIFDLKNNNIYELPPEINLFISEFIQSYIYFEFQITYTDSYPFDPPTWSMISFDDRLTNVKNMINYYNYIVRSHNINNGYSWNPAIDLDKDILYFISKINHFELLTNCI